MKEPATLDAATRRDIERLVTGIAGEIRVVVAAYTADLQAPDTHPGDRRLLEIQTRSIRSELETVHVWTWEGTALERRALALLSMQGAPIPPVAFARSEPGADGRIVMAAPMRDWTGSDDVLARTLAKLHAPNLGKHRPWMPAANPAGTADAMSLIGGRLRIAEVREWLGTPVFTNWSTPSFGPVVRDVAALLTDDAARLYLAELAALGHRLLEREFFARLQDERERADFTS